MYTHYNSPIGPLRLCSDGKALTGVFLPREQGKPDLGERRDDLPLLICVKHWLDRYFAGEAVPVDFPLAPKGTAFQKQVWQILLTIPYGETTTYGAIAGTISQNMSAQAVGQAVGKTPSVSSFPATGLWEPAENSPAMPEDWKIKNGC